MTAATANGPVFFTQRISGISVVVKGNLLPQAIRVTSLALVPEVSLVRIVFLVARVAGERRGFVSPISVARYAGNIFVLPEQRELRFVVIEAVNVLPFFFCMAFLAGLT